MSIFFPRLNQPHTATGDLNPDVSLHMVCQTMGRSGIADLRSARR